jgi:hypothetical protein
MRDNIIDIAVCIGRDLKSRIAVKNLSPELKAMLDAVKFTQHKPKKSAQRSSSRSDMKFSSISQVNKYLDELSFN